MPETYRQSDNQQQEQESAGAELRMAHGSEHALPVADAERWLRAASAITANYIREISS